MEEQQSNIGSKALIPNHFICPLPVWLPYTYASFGQHKLWSKKSIILSSLSPTWSLSVCVSLSFCLMVFTPHKLISTDEKCQGQTTWPIQCLLRGKSSPSSSMRRMFCPTHISQPLDRHVLGRVQGTACCSTHCSLIQGNLHQPNQFCRCKNV